MFFDNFIAYVKGMVMENSLVALQSIECISFIIIKLVETFKVTKTKKNKCKDDLLLNKIEKRL